MARKTNVPPPSLATLSKRSTPWHVPKPVYVVQDSDSDVKKQVCAMQNPNHENKLLALMLLNSHRGQFQLDTGVTLTMLPEKKKLSKKPLVKTFYAY